MTFSRRAPLLLALLLASLPAQAAVIKFATLAPDGTDAMKVLRDIDDEVQKKTGGELKFKFYAGGRQGDEKDMVRKIRVGQLHAGGFTGVGLGEIAPEVRVLDAPWLFRDTAEVDYVYQAFSKDFETAFEKQGYVLLGWTEGGVINIFSNTPVRSKEDARKLKAWVWEGDPIAESAWKALGVHPIPLSITDVNTSLQTGLIDAVYSAPLYAIALQWHEKTKFVNSMAIANASGAVLVSKRFFQTLPKSQQDILLEVSRRRLGTLNDLTRKGNTKAYEVLRTAGLKLTEPAPQQLPDFEEAGRTARRALVGRLYSKELLDRVEKSLETFRSQKKKPS